MTSKQATRRNAGAEPFEGYLQDKLKEPGFRAAYDALDGEHQLRRQLIALRLARGLTQEQLAERVGTKQSGISRLESGSHKPSLAMLEKVAAALEATLDISLKPIPGHHTTRA